jgi:hypothetical protein
MKYKLVIALCVLIIGCLELAASRACEIVVGAGDMVTTISLGDTEPFHTTPNSIMDARCIHVPNSLVQNRIPNGG